MKLFTKKGMILKIAIILVIVILFNFSAPTISYGADVIGGTLLEPIVDLLLAIGDGAINIIQKLLFNIDYSLVKIAVPEAGFWENFGTAVGAVLGVAAVVAITIVTGGTALAAIIPAMVVGGVGAYAGHEIAVEALPQSFYLPIYAISPEEIFQNRIGLLDTNFFNPNQYNKIQTVDGNEVEQVSTAATLQSVISSWYLTLRNFAVVILLLILLYIGIRIVTSSLAQDRAKYKEKLFNWVVAMCLLFFMHYIMSFATTMVEALSEGISSVNKPVIVQMPDLSKYEMEVYEKDATTGEMLRNTVNANKFFSDNGLISNSGVYAWPTNLMGIVRIDMQMDANVTEDNLILRKLGYVILFLVLVFYTVAFLVVYLKRLIMLAFLTMIAPLVAMTYPIDKLHDGNAQAFNMWLKEYIFNLLIQPFHLILYTMLVGAAIDFAKDNIIYAIVAIGFIFQAEKILRKFFGFDKAGTLDTNGSAVGGMLAMAGINQLRKIGNIGKKGGKSGNESGSDKKSSNARVRTADKGKSVRERLDQQQQQQQQQRLPPRSDNTETTNSDDNKTDQEKMLDAYDENYGTDDWDPQERDAMAREANNNNQSGNNYSAEEYEQILRDSGYDEDDIRTMVNDAYPTNDSNDETQAEENVPEPRNTTTNNANTRQNIRTLSNNLGNQIPKKKKSRPIRGVMKVAGAGLKYAIPKAGKLYLKGALGLTAGALGVAGGLASDNDMNILKYGGAGLATGWALGGATSGIIQGASNTVETIGNNIASIYTKAAKGEEAEKERLQAKEDKALMKDASRRKLYAEKVKNVSKSEIKQVMKEAQEYRESGITDDELIIKAMNADGFGEGRANNERIILAGLANEVGNDNKKIKDLESRLKDRGLDDTDVKKYIDGIRDITGAV